MVYGGMPRRALRATQPCSGVRLLWVVTCVLLFGALAEDPGGDGVLDERRDVYGMCQAAGQRLG
jgi:hypothetical protein